MFHYIFKEHIALYFLFGFIPHTLQEISEWQCASHMFAKSDESIYVFNTVSNILLRAQ